MRRLRISTQPISMMRSPSFALSPVVSVSRTICLVNFRYSPVGERVGSFVLRMAGVAFHPVPLYLMARRRGIELLPQVHVLHRLLVRGKPAAPLPRMQPLRDALHDVDRVRSELHPARPLERLQGADGGGQLHAVVRGLRLAAVELL